MATATSMITMRLIIYLAPVGTGGGRVARGLDDLRLGAVGIGQHIDAVPPAAAQRREQRGGVGKARRLRLHQGKQGLLIAALRVEQDDVGDGAEPILAARQIEGVGRRAHRALLRLERGGVQLQRAQRVGDVLKRGQHGVAILRVGLFVGGSGRALLMQQA